MNPITEPVVQGSSANPAVERIIGVSAWSDQVRRSIELVAAHQSSVLIMGPSGTGKELIARAVHSCSARSKKPFIPVDCAVTTGTLFASHMFGHVRGSFTGATSSTLGCFRAAEAGTIFLDEIGEMELELQAKLLRVLQQRVVVPVGSHEEVSVDVRVLAATNRDLAIEVNEGRFREDLFYRLNVVAIRTIPLRERPEDVPILAQRYLAELSARHGMPMCSLAPEAIEVLQQYPWPGNVRELENVLERAVMFSSGDRIDSDSLSGLIAGAENSPVAGAASSLGQMAMAASRGIVARCVSGRAKAQPGGARRGRCFSRHRFLADSGGRGANASGANARCHDAEQIVGREDARHRPIGSATEAPALWSG
jgi:DNA-binding NtrC family response regulator